MGISHHQLGYEPKTITDFVSPEGAQVLGVRCTLLRGALELYREMGVYDAFVAALPRSEHDCILNSLVTSWVPADSVRSFYDASDRLFASDVELARMGEVLGDRISNSLFGALLRPLRSSGIDVMVTQALPHAERLWGRLYRGGGMVIVQTGPKDLVFEARGLPNANSRAFRVAHTAFFRGMYMTVAKACVVKPVVSKLPRSDRYAISVSWV